jgi:cation:H+ antiporter
VLFTGYVIARWEGFLLVGFYGAYITLLALAAAEHPLLNDFRQAMLYFVLPISVLTLGVLTARALRTTR